MFLQRGCLGGWHAFHFEKAGEHELMKGPSPIVCRVSLPRAIGWLLHCICCQAKYFCQGLLWHATWYVFAFEQYPLGQLIFEVSKLNMSSHNIYLCILQWWCVSLFWVSSCWFLAWKLETTQEINHKISPHIFIFHWYRIVVKVDGATPKRWRFVRGHDKPIHGELRQLLSSWYNFYHNQHQLQRWTVMPTASCYGVAPAWAMRNELVACGVPGL